MVLLSRWHFWPNLDFKHTCRIVLEFSLQMQLKRSFLQIQLIGELMLSKGDEDKLRRKVDVWSDET